MGNFKLCKLFDADGDLNTRWFVYFSYIDPGTMKYKRFREMLPTKAKTRSERYAIGKSRIDEINKRLKDGWNPFSSSDPGSINILDAIEKMRIEYKTLRPLTQLTYNGDLNKFKTFLEKSPDKLYQIPLSYFNYQHAQQFMEFVQTEGDISNATYNLTKKRMICNFNKWIHKEWVVTNPFTKVQRLTTSEPEIIGLTADELKIIKEKMPEFNYDLYIYIGLIFYCFIRPNEIQHLKVSNINLEEGFISIPGRISKNKKDGMVNIPVQFIVEMKKLDMNFPQEYYLFSSGLKRGEKLICTCLGTRLWNKFGKKYGIKKPKYALKHTGNGMAVEAGISVRDLQLHNRHSSLDMTQRYLDRFSRKVSTKIINNFPSI